MLDVGWGDLIDYLGDDPHTQSILSYRETIGDARSFLSAAREVALHEPIIVIKAGRKPRRRPQHRTPSNWLMSISVRRVWWRPVQPARQA
jgi:acyl-CoA synthetase (NDP forming)